MYLAINMGEIKIVASGICEKCGHKQSSHEGNSICDEEGCDCTQIGSYWLNQTDYTWNVKMKNIFGKHISLEW